MDRFLLLQLFVLVVAPGLESFPSKLKAWEKCFTDPDYEELVYVAKNGLEKGCHSKKVVIVGAGISGLTAAKLLKDAGCKVLIVEASDRVGGRIVTYHDMDEGWYVDLGPMRLPRRHRVVREFITKFKLKLNPFYNTDDNTWYLVHNIRARAGDVKLKPDILQYPVHPTERGKSASELYGQTLDKVTTDCRVLKEKYDSFSIKEYLIKEGNLSRGAIDMIGDLLNEDGKFQMSFLRSVMDHVTFSENSYDEITGGFDQLPDTFYKNITGEVQFHSMVVKILNEEDQVRVFYHRPDTLVPFSVTADYVLVTATAKAMRHIKFSPPLSTNKTHALRSIHYSEATKIVLVCTEKFWEKDGIHGGRSITDRPSRFVYYPSHNFSSGVGVILASYTSDDDAEYFVSLSDEKCVDVVLEDLAEIHQLPKNYIQKVCDKHVIKKWSLDKYSMGAYVSFTPYQFVDYSKALFQNEGRVHFSGELTAQPHAWIDTAMKSAVRASRNILGAINASPRQQQQVLKENKI
ncbi:L-amino-acid oxidase-like [Emydura macquarii macquarii]|uniref:L-amino-acid oxidase-like n=1 Tax=Emydura macquarii macquarii TaxID=1129001 RepID=UPI00352B16D5